MFDWIYNKTHRIVKRNVYTRDLEVKERWCPQWWFIWWHYHWDQIGYDYYVPESYETLEEANLYLNGCDTYNYAIRKLKQNDRLKQIDKDFS